MIPQKTSGMGGVVK